ncbi:hypothetical protein ONR75_11040 [Rhodopseudomonas sp. P2A-2r]|uniref:hypothetical protein n=1 Tax=Rhodopseudomonas sp. P2A-2r TaxID=2991972 RepID=UPI002234E1BA|nr:hypothetical protein [Rhodopseudomonas sp. P2A-2r]UZE51095.1 hypothetical protein ONR75_11040 [Rhodopseudomonas sp. P2A-2r]
MSARTRLTAPITHGRSRPELKGQEAVSQMADDMRVIKTRVGSVTCEDLGMIGWMMVQVDHHHAAARELAERLSLAAA